MAALGISVIPRTVFVSGDRKIGIFDVTTTGVAGTDTYTVGGLAISTAALTSNPGESAGGGVLYDVQAFPGYNSTVNSVGVRYNMATGKLMLYATTDGTAGANEGGLEFTGVALPGASHYTARLWVIFKGTLNVR
jgi:hypothetical protein